MDFCCPRCRDDLVTETDGYRCVSCAAFYPVIAGIPDFRVYPDPYIDLEADRAKALRLAAVEGRFAALVAHYYAITPEVTPDQARHFTAHHLAGVTRGRALLERLRLYGGQMNGVLLDLGCGTGGLLAALDGDAVGVDIALRWLVVARRRLDELGCAARLVCACADYLPFRDAQFDVITAENLIEHMPDAVRLLAEIARVGRPGAFVMGRAVNRFAIGPEPHVGVWGVGFLPRRWMNAYVQWRRGLPYEHIYLRSVFELRRAAQVDKLRNVHIQYPLLLWEDYQHQPSARRRLFTWYARLGESLPPLRPVLTLFGPYLDFVGRIGASS